MGNSEVGHLNLGAGFVVAQDLVRIGDAIASGTFFANPALVHACRLAAESGARLHLVGLVGEGGVHAHDAHLAALLELARRHGLRDVAIHAITDGRDSSPTAAAGVIRALVERANDLGTGRVATVTGRYYAMDRDARWERTRRFCDALVHGAGRPASDAAAAVEASYAAGITDEFVEPIVLEPAEAGTLRSGDVVVLFNFRADRMRQLLAFLTGGHDLGAACTVPAGLHVVTMTEYFRDGQSAPVAFPPNDVEWPVARIVADRGLKQFHTAETEKYAHVTYFFNGGRDRALVPSPRVATYDLQPEMSAVEVTDGLVARLATGADAFAIVNYANADMVGHTGVLPAAIRAVETVDECLGRVVAAVDARGGFTVITADHGNAEMMIDPATGGPHTAHTLNPTPLIVTGPGMRRSEGGAVRDGRLCDVATTVLDLLGLPAAPAMTGAVLAAPGGA
jgi:2,3-bisphosphoglycerate-independent phosphoglycerate mutase